MADDKPEDAGLAPDSGRAKRNPPTIDLEATEVSTQPQQDAGEPETPLAVEEPQPEASHADETKTEPEPERAEAQTENAASPPDSPPVSPSTSPSTSSSISPWVIAPFSGAVAAALVIAVGWMLGWPAVEAPPAAPQVTSAAVEALSGRVAAVEARVGKPVADPAATARIDALEKSASALRSDVAGLRTQTDKVASDAKSAPRNAAAPAELTALTDRVAQLERSITADRTELAQQREKIADARPPNDLPLRQVVAATLLDVAVRHGDPYASQLAAARTLAANADVLKPLDMFAASGIPTPVALCRELLNIVPKLAPPAETPSAGLIERLESKLVRIERTDGVGNDRGAIVARVTAAALRNDFVEARRELKLLAEADRVPAQAWLEKTNARDAALAASRKFADDAMADLAKPVQ
jgi:hypothetical protein